MVCKKEHRYLPDLRDLPDSQAGQGRHMCAGCAYEQGYDTGFEGHVKHLDVSLLDESQAGTGRHKDTQSAYDLGYTHGQRRRNNPV